MRTLEANEQGRVTACRTDELDDGERLLITVGRKRIGLFRVDGRFFALHGVCPHAGGALCEGPLTGTTRAAAGDGDFFGYEYDREGHVLRCAWHGWEFDVESGRSLVDSRIGARTYPVHVDDGSVVIDVKPRRRPAA